MSTELRVPEDDIAMDERFSTLKLRLAVESGVAFGVCAAVSRYEVDLQLLQITIEWVKCEEREDHRLLCCLYECFHGVWGVGDSSCLCCDKRGLWLQDSRGAGIV